MKEKQKYSTWDGVKYMIRTAWDHRPSVLILCVLLALVDVGIRLVNLYCPGNIKPRGRWRRYWQSFMGYHHVQSHAVFTDGLKEIYRDQSSFWTDRYQTRTP